MLVASTTYMVSLDDAVIARLEKGGSRYEILVDPDLVDAWNCLLYTSPSPRD